MEIRPAAQQDLASVSKLQQEFIQEHARLYDDDFYALAPDAADQWLRWAEKMLEQGALGLFVASEHELIGYVSGWTQERPPIYALRTTGYLSNLFVITAWRQQGVGRALHSALLQWFKTRHARRIELAVDARAASAYAAWYSFGYREVAKRMRLDAA